MYHIFIETRFSAAHSIQKYKGPCGDLHGHTWKVRVEVKTDRTNELGISIDFKDLKQITESVVKRLDHQHINKISPFNHMNPTAENIAKYIYHEIKGSLPESIHMASVIVWESDFTGVTYSETSFVEGQ